MPHISSRGDVAHGVGGGMASLNNVAFGRGGVGGWIDDDTIAFTNGDDSWVVSKYHVPTKTISRLADVGANVMFAGGWHAAWWFGTTDERRGLYTTTGFRAQDAGLLGMGPDGAIGYKPLYQSNGPSLVRDVDGREWLLTPGHASALCLLGNGRAIWLEGFTVRSVGFDTPPLYSADGGIWGVKAVQFGARWWISYYSGAHGIVLHPVDSFLGFSVLPKGDGWHTIRAIDTDVIRVAVSRGEGEQPGDIWIRDYDVVRDLMRDPWATRISEPGVLGNTWLPVSRVGITTINGEPSPPPPPPEDPVLQPPRFTISEPRFPVTGVAPLALRCYAMLEPGAGEPEWIEWQVSTQGRGGPWTVAARNFEDDPDHTFRVSVAGTFWIRARAGNAAGEHETGLERRVTVTAQDVVVLPPPLPPLRDPRIWLAPNIGSRDAVQLTDDPAVLARVGVVQLYVQMINSLGEPTDGPVGPNLYAAFVAADWFRTLRAAGVALGIEMGSVKPSDLHAEANMGALHMAVTRVREAGGDVAYVSMDEPMTYGAAQPLEETADAVVAFMRAGADLGVPVGWIEAWPNVLLEQQRKFLMLLDERGVVPTHWHFDIDWGHAEQLRLSISEMLHAARSFAYDYGMALGVIIAGYSHATDAEYAAEMLQKARVIKACGVPLDHILVQSWATRTGGTQDLPPNFGDDGLLVTVARIVEVFA